MKRKVGYTWRLREIMAQHQIFTATELVPLLRERGIDLSASQVHRLVSGTPERLSLQVMAALCDILSCTPADLVATTAEEYASSPVRDPCREACPAPWVPVAATRNGEPAGTVATRPNAGTLREAQDVSAVRASITWKSRRGCSDANAAGVPDTD